MKKELLFLVFLLFTFFYSNAQVIDLIGEGVFGKANSNLPLTNINNIDSVKVGAIYKSSVVASLKGVEFWDTDETRESAWNNIRNNRLGYFSRTFSTSDNNGVNADIKIDHVHSFYGYIYRNIPTALFKSYIDTTTAYMYHNGSAEPYLYSVPIDSDSDARDITIKIPITELDDTGRSVVIDIQAGTQSYHTVEYTYNFGNSFFIGEYTLTNVPGNIITVTVSIYSPDPDEGEGDGDSFFVNGIVVDVEKVGCTLTQGYWKNHSTCKKNGNGPERDVTWDKLPNGEDTEFFLSNQNYCQVFDTNPGKGGKYYILAHQYIAAELNILAGANPSAALAAFNEATEFLHSNSPEEVDDKKSLKDKCVELGGILDEYNNGRIGPGHCDDEDDDEAAIEPVKQKIQKDKVSVYPNPATTYGKIEFTPKQSATTTVELYSISGQIIGVIYNQKTKKGIPVLIEYNAEQFKKGLYFAIIRNGSKVYKEKISITK